MPYVMVDIESDGPIPGDYSMICFGAVIVEPALGRTFYGQLRPISEKFIHWSSTTAAVYDVSRSIRRDVRPRETGVTDGFTLTTLPSGLVWRNTNPV